MATESPKRNAKAKVNEFEKALKGLDREADRLMVESGDYAEYPDDRSREMLRRAAKVIRQTRLALALGRAYTVTGAAQEFDHTVQSEG